MVQYTISEINTIQQNGFDYQLEEEVIHSLRELYKHFKNNTDVIRPISFRKSTFSFNKPTTVLREEEKENGVVVARLLLNKISQKNYLDCVEKLDEMLLRFTEDERRQIAELLFEVASTNRFYTSVYADIYSHLMTFEPVMEVFSQYYETRYSKFLEMFDNIVYVDPNTDYDLFCDMNLKNEKRKALCTFLACLMRNNIIPAEHVQTVLRTLLEKTQAFITEANRVNEVDEMVENINCLYIPSCHHSRFHPKLATLAAIKYKQFPSLSSKTLFKLQDIAKKPASQHK